MGPGDTTPPQILDFDVLTTTLRTSAGNSVLTYRIHVTEDLSGLGSPGRRHGGFGFNFSYPGGGVGYSPSRQLISGTPANGIWEGKVDFGNWANPGNYEVTQVYASDTAGNRVTVQDPELSALGWDFAWVNQP